jgi:hypothetical protein
MSSSLAFFCSLFSFVQNKKNKERKEKLIENYLTDAHVHWPLGNHIGHTHKRARDINTHHNQR